MCLGFDCLTCTVQFQAWIIFFLAICAIAGSIEITVQQHKIDSHFQSIGFAPPKGLMISSWVFSGTLLLISIFGIIAEWKDHGWFKRISDWGNIFCTIAFALLCAYAFLQGDEFVDNQNSSNYCLEYEWSLNLQDLALAGSQNFCQLGCQCYIANTSLVNATDLFYNDTNPFLPFQFQQCPQYLIYEQSVSNTQQLAEVLSFSESTYYCSGWCDKEQIYMFSNVNKGQPYVDNCFDSIFKVLRNSGYLLGYISGIVSISLGACVLMTCCQTHHPKQKEIHEMSMIAMSRTFDSRTTTTRHTQIIHSHSNNTNNSNDSNNYVHNDNSNNNSMNNTNNNSINNPVNESLEKSQIEDLSQSG